MLSRGTRPDERHRDVERVLDEPDVRARGVGKLVLDRLLPPGEHLEHRAAVMKVALVRREVLRFRVVRELDTERRREPA